MKHKQGAVASVGKTLEQALAKPEFFWPTCSLCIIWAWFMFMGNPSDTSLGLAIDRPDLFKNASIVAVALVMLAAIKLCDAEHISIAFSCSSVFCAIAATVLVSINTSAFWGGAAHAIICGALAGAGYALALALWLMHNRTRDFSLVLACMLCASAFVSILYGLLSSLNSAVAFWFSALLMCLAPPIVIRQPTLALHPAVSADNDRANLPPSSLSDRTAFFISLVLCGGLVSGILMGNWTPTTSFSWIWALFPIGFLGTCLCIVARARLTQSIVQLCLTGVICLTAIFALILPSAHSVLASLMFADGWYLFSFYLGTCLWRGHNLDSKSPRAIFFLTLIFFAAMGLAQPILLTIPKHNMALLVVAVVALALSLVASTLSLMLAAQAESKRTAQTKGQYPRSTEEACQKLADSANLTERESEVLVLLAKGYSVKGMSEKLFISENTAKSHRRHIYQKLGVNSRQSLITLIEES